VKKILTEAEERGFTGEGVFAGSAYTHNKDEVMIAKLNEFDILENFTIEGMEEAIYTAEHEMGYNENNELIVKGKKKLAVAKIASEERIAAEKEEARKKEGEAASVAFDFDDLEVEEVDLLQSNAMLLRRRTSVSGDDIDHPDVEEAFNGMAECFVQMDFKIEELKYPGPYPSGIRMDKREHYLPPAMFKTTFGMNIEEFMA
jgi:hypothetical protein